MGYSTDFLGQVRVTPPLNAAERAYLTRFSATRRMKVKEGPYFVDQAGMAGQDEAANVIDYNAPPDGQPGLWCQWTPVEGGAALAWNGTEKFYEADEWMQYLIDHFLKPGAEASGWEDPQFEGFTFDHVVSGSILASGEEYPDLWRLDVRDNAVDTFRYEVPDHELPDAIFESGHSFGDVIFAMREDPKDAAVRLGKFLEAVPEECAALPVLREFLGDLARALPEEQGRRVSEALAGGPI